MRRVPISLFSICLLPNHLHALLQMRQPHQLSAFVHWWLTNHIRRYHRHYHSSGRIWQGRFKSFPIHQDEHLLTVMRHVLLNPVRAGFVARAGDWTWPSLHCPLLLDPSPVPPPQGWDNLLARPTGGEGAAGPLRPPVLSCLIAAPSICPSVLM
jgi:putative transposase